MNRAPLVLAALVLAAFRFPARAPPHNPGTLTGVLRHKGCTSAPSGATVGVIGRDATSRSDADGKFTLSLPAGTYSIVIGGPGLVSDQRVDDIALAAGETRDLGPVEVWPEERPAGCVPGAPQPPAIAPVVATAPETPAVDLPGGAVAATAPPADAVWLRGGGGSGPAQFGFQGSAGLDDEDALGPCAFALGPQGTLAVLDGLNGRLLRFDARGVPLPGFPLPSHGAEPLVEADLAASDDGHLFLFTAADPPQLGEHDAAGRLVAGGALPAAFRGIDQLLLVRQRPLFLMQNGQAVRADLGWGGIRAEGPLPGIPAGGGLHARVERADRWRVVLKLSTLDGRVRRSVQLHSRVPVSGVRLVGTGRRGDVVVAVDRAEGRDEGTPRAEVLLLAIDPQGHLAGALAVPPGGRRYEFREFALAADGTVVQMQSDAAEVRFVRWTLRPLPRAAAAGEGLVRGRILDGAQAGAGASVTVAHSKKQVAVAADGSFELRLPAGTYLVQIRRAAAQTDFPPLEIRVAVAPGSTVDLGNVALATWPPIRATPVPPVPFPAEAIPLPLPGERPPAPPGAGPAARPTDPPALEPH